jgi:hypothetical protein
LEYAPRACPKLEPQEKELCAGPPAAFGFSNGSGGGGAVLPGGLRVGSPVTVCRSTTTTTTTKTTTNLRWKRWRNQVMSLGPPSRRRRRCRPLLSSASRLRSGATGRPTTRPRTRGTTPAPTAATPGSRKPPEGEQKVKSCEVT